MESGNIFDILEGDNSLAGDTPATGGGQPGKKPEVKFIKNPNNGNNGNNQQRHKNNNNGGNNGSRNNNSHNDSQKNRNQNNNQGNNQNNGQNNHAENRNGGNNANQGSGNGKPLNGQNRDQNNGGNNNQNHDRHDRHDNNRNNGNQNGQKPSNAPKQEQKVEGQEDGFVDTSLFEDMEQLATNTLNAGMAVEQEVKDMQSAPAPSEPKKEESYVLPEYVQNLEKENGQTSGQAQDTYFRSEGYVPQQRQETPVQPAREDESAPVKRESSPATAFQPEPSPAPVPAPMQNNSRFDHMPGPREPFAGYSVDKSSPSVGNFFADSRTISQISEPSSSDRLRRVLPSVGARTDVHTAARLLHCAEDELIEVTTLLNEYLTVTKVNDIYMYNRFDIERLQQLFGYMEGKVGQSDDMMLKYADTNFSKPFDTKMEEITSIPMQIEETVRGMMNSYTLDIKNFLAPLVTNMGGYMKMTGQALRHQEQLMENNRRTIEEQERTIKELSASLYDLTSTSSDLKVLAQAQAENSKTYSVEMQNQTVQLNEVLSQLKSSQGNTAKTLNALSETLSQVAEDSAKVPEDRTDEILSALEALTKAQEENKAALDAVNDAIGEIEAAPPEDPEKEEALAENEELKAKVESYESEIQAKDDAIREKDEALAAAGELQKQLDDYQSKLDDLNASMQQATEYRTKLETAIKNIAKESDEKTEMIGALQSQLAEQDRAESEGYYSPAPAQDGYYQAPQQDEGYYQPAQTPVQGQQAAYPNEYDDYQPAPAGGPTVTINRPGQSAVQGALKEAAEEEEPPKKKKRGFFRL